jgi:ubiquitin thioesterase protein OTUB1
VHGYAALRRSQGDGNCFYRCILFGLLEWLVNATDEASKAERAAALRATADRAAAVARRAGLESFVFEDPVDSLRTLVGFALQETAPMTVEGLRQRFNNEASTAEAAEVSYALWMLRMSASSHMKSEEEFYLPFILGTEMPGDEPYNSVKEYTIRNVDNPGAEAEHVSITALCAALGLRVKVAYLDGGFGGELVTFHEFGDEPELPNSATPVLHLLYRPGHYDLLSRTQ